MIIDSPGVGEADEMDDMVIQYLSEAFAFVYVANSSLGGGVQKDKVSTWRVCVCFSEIPFEKTGVLSSFFFMQIYLDAFFLRIAYNLSASHTGVFRGASFSSLHTNACSTENNIPFPLSYLRGKWPMDSCEMKCWQAKHD